MAERRRKEGGLLGEFSQPLLDVGLFSSSGSRSQSGTEPMFPSARCAECLFGVPNESTLIDFVNKVEVNEWIAPPFLILIAQYLFRENKK